MAGVCGSVRTRVLYDVILNILARVVRPVLAPMVHLAPSLSSQPDDALGSRVPRRPDRGSGLNNFHVVGD